MQSLQAPHHFHAQLSLGPVGVGVGVEAQVHRLSRAHTPTCASLSMEEGPLLLTQTKNQDVTETFWASS